jgi:hypothetical protein
VRHACAVQASLGILRQVHGLPLVAMPLELHVMLVLVQLTAPLCYVFQYMHKHVLTKAACIR